MSEIGNKAVNTSIDLIDETFDVSQSESYRLLVQTGADGLSFCIFNTVLDKFIVLRHYQFSAANGEVLTDTCRNILAEDDLLGLKYKNCGILYVSPRCTLVPEPLFDSDHIAEYLNFNHGRDADECVLHNHIRSAKAVNVFSYPKNLTNLFRQYQPGADFYHHATPFLNRVVDKSATSGQLQVTVYCYADYMDIAAAKNGKLLLYNTFNANTAEDSVYYLTGVLNMFDLFPSSAKVFYAGDLKDASPRAEFIRKYVERLVELESIGEVTYSHYITDRIRARFVHLFNLHGCVS